LDERANSARQPLLETAYILIEEQSQGVQLGAHQENDIKPFFGWVDDLIHCGLLLFALMLL